MQFDEEFEKRAGFDEEEIKKLTEGAAKIQKIMMRAMIRRFWFPILVSLLISSGAVVGLIYLVIYLIKHV